MSDLPVRIGNARATRLHQILSKPQLLKMYFEARQQGINLNEVCQKVYSCNAEELTDYAASAVLDWLSERRKKQEVA